MNNSLLQTLNPNATPIVHSSLGAVRTHCSDDVSHQLSGLDELIIKVVSESESSMNSGNIYYHCRELAESKHDFIRSLARLHQGGHLQLENPAERSAEERRYIVRKNVSRKANYEINGSSAQRAEGAENHRKQRTLKPRIPTQDAVDPVVQKKRCLRNRFAVKWNLPQPQIWRWKVPC